MPWPRSPDADADADVDADGLTAGQIHHGHASCGFIFIFYVAFE
jgi:hypothetical protein